jgi:Acetylornithine deacetylase/Succinyl-diaminopimel ate desuccinylase and related deacylases
MNPKKHLMKLKNHLKSKGFGDVKIKVYHGEAAARTDSSHPFVSQVKDASDKIFGTSILNVSNAGTGPMYPFVDILKSPCISIGSTYMFSRIHSPNEFARVDLLKKTTKCMCLIMQNFGKN